MIINLPGCDYPVIVTSIALEKKAGPIGALAVARMGGIVSFLAVREDMLKVLDERRDDMDQSVIEDFKAIQDGHYILYYREFADCLTLREFTAVLLHETGHIVSGHLVQAGEEGRKGIILKREWELEADQYAVKYGYGLDMASALKKLTRKMVRITYRYGGWREALKLWFSIHGDPIFRERRKVLIG